MKNWKMPDEIDGFKVLEDGTLEKGGMTVYPWFNEEGFIGGHVRYRLVAEEASREEMFLKTQENSE